MRKGNRSTGVAYETVRKRMRGHQHNLGLCFPESQLTPPDVHPLDIDNMVQNLIEMGTDSNTKSSQNMLSQLVVLIPLLI